MSDRVSRTPESSGSWRVCIIVPSSAIGGAEHYVVQVANSLLANGHSVVLVVKDDANIIDFFAGRISAPIFAEPISWEGGPEDFSLGERLITKVLAQAEAAARAVVDCEASVVLVNLPWPDFGHGIVLATAALAVPTLVLCHLCPRVVPMPKELQPIYRALAAAGQKYAAVSGDSRHFYSASTSIPRSDIAVLYNGVEVDPRWAAIKPGERDGERARLRAELGLPSNARFAVTVGRLDYQKGHLDLVDAAARARYGREDIHYLWLGDGPLRRHLADVVACVGLSDTIHILGHRDDVPRFLALADFLVAPSFFEGFSLTLLEAASYGCPILSSDCSGTREFITGPETGRVFRTGHCAELADAIAWAADNPSLLAAIGESGRRRVVDFTPQHMVGALEARLGAAARDVNREAANLGPLAPLAGERRGTAIALRDRIRAVLTKPNDEPVEAAAGHDSAVLAATWRELLVRHRASLRRMLGLRPLLHGQPCPVIAEDEVDDWLHWRVWQYAAFWIIAADDAHCIAARLVRVDRAAPLDDIGNLKTLVSVLVPSELPGSVDADREPLSLVLAPRMAWRKTAQGMCLDAEPGETLPEGLAAGVGIAGGALHVIAQLAAYLGCDRLLATPRVMGRIPRGGADLPARPGEDAALRAGVSFRSPDGHRVVDVLTLTAGSPTTRELSPP